MKKLITYHSLLPHSNRVDLMLALYGHWRWSEAAAPEFREIFWTFKQCLCLFRSELAGGRCRFSVSERLKKTKCEMLPPPQFRSSTSSLKSVDAQLRRCNAGWPENHFVLAFQAHAIQMCLGDPDTMINGHSLLSPSHSVTVRVKWAEDNNKQSLFCEPPDTIIPLQLIPLYTHVPMRKRGRAMGKKCGHSNGSQENPAVSHQHTRS